MYRRILLIQKFLQGEITMGRNWGTFHQWRGIYDTVFQASCWEEGTKEKGRETS